MGNCQTIDAAALVIQHPSGKLERMYWPVTAREVMKTNPGHYVSLIIPLPVSGDDGDGGGENSGDRKTVRFTTVKLLRPTDTLCLGRAYRLVTTQEVVKVLRAKKQAKMKKNGMESVQFEVISKSEKNDKEEKGDERHRQTSSGSTNLGGGRPKSWRPSLQSISESGNGQ